MSRPVAVLRLLVLGSVRALRSLVLLPARAVAAIDHAVVERMVGAVVGLYWFAAAIVAELVDRHPAALSAFCLLFVVSLLLFFPR